MNAVARLPRRCRATGCSTRSGKHHGFCADCWFTLPQAIRAEINFASGGKNGDVAFWQLCDVASRRLAGLRRNQVALCGTCSHPTADATIVACARPDCPFTERAAA